ncbi:MAG: VWA domain-containing protein [Candidatus Competibacter sp.]|nr:VWA domain-containing protein [Candidatus Competibacter sp.]
MLHRFLYGLALASLLAGLARAAEPVLLRLQQASAAPPPLTAYLTLEDLNERPLPDLTLTPTQFSATVGAQPATVTAVEPFAKAGEGIAYLLLVDISRSLREPQFAKLRQALGDWVNALGPRDRAALLTFGTDVRLVQDFTADKAALQAHLAYLKPSDDQTRLNLALLRALELSRRPTADQPRRRVIVLLSDGQDDVAGSVTLDEVQAALNDQRTPIFALGLANPPRTPARDAALKTLGMLARRSGGAYQNLGETPLPTAYAELRRRIEQAIVVRLDCPTCPAEGGRQRLRIEWQSGAQRLADEIDVRLPPPPPKPPEPAQPAEPPKPAEPPEPVPAVAPAPDLFRQGWVWAVVAGLALLLVLAVVGTAILVRRRRLPALPATHDAVVPAVPPISKTVAATPEPPGLPVRLVPVGASPGQPYNLEVRDRAVIGRRPDCHLVIADDDLLSGAHCALVRAGDRLLLEDLGSTNGTQVNGVPIHGRHPLNDGDRIQAGRLDLRLMLPGSPP